MEAISTTTTGISHPTHLSPIHGLMDKWEHILRQHRMDNPDLYRMLQQKKNDANSIDVEHNTQLKRAAVANTKTHSILNQSDLM